MPAQNTEEMSYDVTVDKNPTLAATPTLQWVPIPASTPDCLWEVRMMAQAALWTTWQVQVFLECTNKIIWRKIRCKYQKKANIRYSFFLQFFLLFLVFNNNFTIEFITTFNKTVFWLINNKYLFIYKCKDE